MPIQLPNKYWRHTSNCKSSYCLLKSLSHIYCILQLWKESPPRNTMERGLKGRAASVSVIVTDLGWIYGGWNHTAKRLTHSRRSLHCCVYFFVFHSTGVFYFLLLMGWHRQIVEKAEKFLTNCNICSLFWPALKLLVYARRFYSSYAQTTYAAIQSQNLLRFKISLSTYL